MKGPQRSEGLGPLGQERGVPIVEVPRLPRWPHGFAYKPCPYPGPCALQRGASTMAFCPSSTGMAAVYVLSFFGKVTVMKTWVLCSAVALLGALHAPAFALPVGSDAKDCMQVHTGQDSVQLANHCGAPVFILWCGELRYSKERCGDGKNGGFYTHSANVPPGDRKRLDVKGRIQWAACAGKIGFGNDRNFEDQGNGAYRCLPR